LRKNRKAGRAIRREIRTRCTVLLRWYTKDPRRKEMGERKRYASEEKVKILRELLEDGKPVSHVAESHSVHPNLVLNWRRERSSRSSCSRGAPKTFEARRPDIAGKAAEQKAQALEEKLREKDGVIAELAQEVMTLKKRTYIFTYSK
jgi:transposase-like protein